MPDLKENWDYIKETIRTEYQLTDISYDTWIKPLRLYGIENNTVIIFIPSDNDIKLNYIKNNYSDFFVVTISEFLGQTYSVEFKNESSVEKKEEVKPESNNIYNVNYANANLNPEYKFESFIVGKHNNMAHAAALAIAEKPGKVFNPFFIYGGSGLGKTHLMHAIGHFILEQNPKMKILYVSSDKFTEEIVNSIRGGNENTISKVKEKYKSVDVLMVDDIQYIIGRDRTQEEFFNIFNALHAAHKQIIISSDIHPNKLEKLEERFSSRFKWGVIQEILAPDYETRMAILMKKAEKFEKKFDKSIIEYIAKNIDSNIRELEGAINKIYQFSKLNNVELDLSLAEEALRDVINPDKPYYITPTDIIRAVAEHYNISEDLITSTKRSKDVVIPRQIVMYLCCQLTDFTLESISKILKRDHSSVINGRDKIEKLIKTDSDLSSKIEVIKRKIIH